MRLYAILCWWDESPTWLAATVASLAKLGVDHVVAVDGKYPLFQRGRPVASNPDQVEAIHSAAYALGMGVTIHQPAEWAARDEVQKRSFAFGLVEAIAQAYTDWVLVIDADELVRDGADVKPQLAALDADTHVMELLLASAADHHAEPGPDNNMTAASEELAQKHRVPSEFAAWQSRIFRVMRGMNTGANHWAYNALDEQGRRVYLRADTGEVSGLPVDAVVSPHARDEQRGTILHRHVSRIRTRREAKVRYYDERDKLGLESAAITFV